MKFAASLGSWADGKSQEELTDHADELLGAVITDMNSSQSAEQQSEKSKGHSTAGPLGAVGRKHAGDRLMSGQNLTQLV